MSRIIQTFWTNPMTDLYQSMRLAYASAKSIKAQGYNLAVYTDSKGAELLKGFPYDEIIVLDELENLNPSLFCAVKYLALETEPIGSIHVDFDVIIDKPVFKWETDKDVITQCYEGKVKYSKEQKYLSSFLAKKDLSVFDKDFMKNKVFRPYCCGVIGFNNETLKESFISAYKEILYCFDNVKVPNGLTIDYIVEQAYISHLVSSNSYIPQFIDTCNIEACKHYQILDGCAYYRTDGYVHYHGKSKYTREAQTSINELLTKEDKKIINHNFCIKEENSNE